MSGASFSLWTIEAVLYQCEFILKFACSFSSPEIFGTSDSCCKQNNSFKSALLIVLVCKHALFGGNIELNICSYFVNTWCNKFMIILTEEARATFQAKNWDDGKKFASNSRKK